MLQNHATKQKTLVSFLSPDGTLNDMDIGTRGSPKKLVLQDGFGDLFHGALRLGHGWVLPAASALLGLHASSHIVICGTF